MATLQRGCVGFPAEQFVSTLEKYTAMTNSRTLSLGCGKKPNEPLGGYVD
jgi:hypothetical protein